MRKLWHIEWSIIGVVPYWSMPMYARGERHLTWTLERLSATCFVATTSDVHVDLPSTIEATLGRWR